MMGRPLYVRDLPEDLHAWLESQPCSKRAALIALLRAARDRGLSVGMAVSETRSDT